MLDLLLVNIQIADLFRLRTFGGWVGVADGRFVYVEEGDPPADITAQETVDVGRQVLVPGLLPAVVTMAVGEGLRWLLQLEEVGAVLACLVASVAVYGGVLLLCLQQADRHDLQKVLQRFRPGR